MSSAYTSKQTENDGGMVRAEAIELRTPLRRFQHYLGKNMVHIISGGLILLTLSLLWLLFYMVEHAPHRPVVVPEKLLDRFVEYCKIDTQAVPGPKIPSSQGQCTLAHLLVKHLHHYGVKDARVTELCFVLAHIPASKGVAADAPTIGFLAHLDTSPETSGKDVSPVVHYNYTGGDIVLGGEPAEVIPAAQLRAYINQTIITTNGSTLLGADDKAGIAEILEAVKLWQRDPALRHPKIAIAFTPDEEGNGGVHHIDVEEFGATYAYTIDGARPGAVQFENFYAYEALLDVWGKDVVPGVNTHPGSAYGRMRSSIKIMSQFVDALPPKISPEESRGREGFIHPYEVVQGNVGHSSLRMLLRAFDMGNITHYMEILNDTVAALQEEHNDTVVEVTYMEQYRNMKEVVDRYPQVIDTAFDACRQAGLTPVHPAIRGGTDGAWLSFHGVPTPNIFTGGENAHSITEFAVLESMESAVEVIVNIGSIFAKNYTKS